MTTVLARFHFTVRSAAWISGLDDDGGQAASPAKSGYPYLAVTPRKSKSPTHRGDGISTKKWELCTVDEPGLTTACADVILSSAVAVPLIALGATSIQADHVESLWARPGEPRAQSQRRVWRHDFTREAFIVGPESGHLVILPDER